MFGLDKRHRNPRVCKVIAAGACVRAKRMDGERHVERDILCAQAIIVLDERHRQSMVLGILADVAYMGGGQAYVRGE